MEQGGEGEGRGTGAGEGKAEGKKGVRGGREAAELVRGEMRLREEDGTGRGGRREKGKQRGRRE